MVNHNNLIGVNWRTIRKWIILCFSDILPKEKHCCIDMQSRPQSGTKLLMSRDLWRHYKIYGFAFLGDVSFRENLWTNANLILMNVGSTSRKASEWGNTLPPHEIRRMSTLLIPFKELLRHRVFVAEGECQRSVETCVKVKLEFLELLQFTVPHMHLRRN